MHRRASSWTGPVMAAVGQAAMQAVQVPQWSGAKGAYGGQVDVHEQSAEEEPASEPGIEQHRVLADPAEPGPRGQRDLHHGRAVREDAIAERADRVGDAVGERAAAACATTLW